MGRRKVFQIQNKTEWRRVMKKLIVISVAAVVGMGALADFDIKEHSLKRQVTRIVRTLNMLKVKSFTVDANGIKMIFTDDSVKRYTKEELR
jgi:hypothetical protein